MPFGGAVGQSCDVSVETTAHMRHLRARALSAGSIDKRMSILVRCEQHIAHPLVGATTDELAGWIAGQQVSDRTRYAYISHLGCFFTWALIEGLVTHDPTLRLVRPKVRIGLPHPVATHDLERLIHMSPTTEMTAMLHLAAHAGLRCMEIAQLDAPEVRSYLDPPALVVLNGKGGRDRVVPMSDALVAALVDYGIPRSGPMFRDVDTLGRLQPWKVSHIIRKHMDWCGVFGSAHHLRHSFATEVYRRSHDIRLTQELMGHSSPATTAIYTKFSQDEAAAVVKAMYVRPA